MIAELVTARADVPGLGNQLDPRQKRILPQRVEKAGAGIKAVGLAPKLTPRSKRKPST